MTISQNESQDIKWHDPVIVRNSEEDIWKPAWFLSIDNDKERKYITTTGEYKYCMEYDRNKIYEK